MAQMDEDDIDDARFVEGGDDAVMKVKALLIKLRKSPEVEGNVDLILSQKGKTKADEDPLETFEFDHTMPLDDVAMAIVDRAEEEIDGRRTKKMAFSVRADGVANLRATFTLTYEGGEDEDMDDMPNRKGLMTMLMKHQEGIYRLSVTEAAKTIQELRQELKEKNDLISTLVSKAMENIKVFEDLVSGRHARDIELRAIERKEERMDQVAGTLMKAVPMLGAALLGGQAANAAVATAGNGFTPLEGVLHQFVSTLDGAQFNKIVESGMFTEQQILMLVEILKIMKAKEEAEAAAKGAAQGQANGQTTPEPHPPQAQP